jgi:hypothetical protein
MSVLPLKAEHRSATLPTAISSPVTVERSQLTSTSPPRSIALTTGLSDGWSGMSDGATERRGKQWIKEKAQG